MIVSSFVTLALAFSAPGALAGPVQRPGIRLPRSAAENKAAVVDIFKRSYNAYRWVLHVSLDDGVLTRCFVENLPLGMMISHLCPRVSLMEETVGVSFLCPNKYLGAFHNLAGL